jgi:hypothetical protein
MKRIYLLALLVLLAGLFPGLLILNGCSGSSPSQAQPQSPTATTTPAPASPIIIAYISVNGTYNEASAFISDSSGSTSIAGVGVTLISAGVTTPLTSLPVTTVITVTDHAITFTGAPYLTGAFYSGAITYTAGQIYTFNVSVGNTTYTASVTGLSASPSVQPSSGTSGVTCAWPAGVGNKDFITVLNSSDAALTYIGPIISPNPYIVPNSDFTNETPGAGSDSVVMSVVQFAAGAFPGAQASSCAFSQVLAQGSY